DAKDIFPEPGHPAPGTEVPEDDRVRLASREHDDADVEIGPAVVIEVLQLDMWRLHLHRLEPRLLRHVLEARDAAVETAGEVQPRWHTPRHPRVAVMVADDDIHQTIAVDVPETDTARGVVQRLRELPAEVGMALWYLLEPALAVVEEQPIAPLAAAKEQVGPA